MKHTLYILLMAVCSVALLCSCNKASDITVDEDNVTFAINGGEKTIEVTADGRYSIEDCPDWVKTVADESTLTFIVEENTTGAVRKCVVRLVGSDIEVPITIRQAVKCTFIKVSETDVTIPKEGGDKVITVDTDGKITMNVCEGVEAKLAGDKLTISAPANPGGTIHGTLTLTSDAIRTEVNVTVEGSLCPTCDGTGKAPCPHCGGKGYTTKVVYGEFGDRYEEYYACSTCGGFGVQYSDGLIDGLTERGFRKGSGRISCPDCGGTGH